MNESVFLRFPQVIEKVSFSKSTINRREREGRFPPRIKWGKPNWIPSIRREKVMRFNTKDELGYFGLKDLLNQLGKDQGYKTAEDWDSFLHSYCSSLLDGTEEF